MKRYLVTTADERTWKFDRPVLFLGEWCRLYDRKHIWEKMDAIVAAPYGIQDEQKEHDLTYVHALTDQLLGELTDALNTFHHTSYSVRYWHILIGRWLSRYVSTVFNRYATIEQVLKDDAVSETTIFIAADYDLATSHSLAFIWATHDDVWNHVLYANILAFLGSIEVEKDAMTLRGVQGFSLRPTTAHLNLKRYMLNTARSLLQKLSRRRDAVIVNSYLPLPVETRLQLSLGQCPQLWRSPALVEASVDRDKRQGLCLDATKHIGFERFIRLQMRDIIPTCYLEGYDQLVEQADAMSWPAEPRFIFTSNQFDTDEVFKAWAGSMVERGVPYFVGQHGNNYGTLHDYASWPELVTSDKFFTWGWTDGNPKNIPAFVFKTAGRKLQHRRNDGGVLLVELGVPHRTTPWDSYFEFRIYQEEQYRFVDALPDAIRDQLTVRLYRPGQNLRWFDAQRWQDRHPRLHIDPGIRKIQEAIVQNRLIVHSYDSTGILETLALNVPTLCFWHGGLSHLSPSAKPYYEQLRDAKILLDTPEGAAEMVSLHWNDVDKWWNTSKVQNARKVFCAQFARTTNTPVRTMKGLLTEHEAMPPMLRGYPQAATRTQSTAR